MNREPDSTDSYADDAPLLDTVQVELSDDSDLEDVAVHSDKNENKKEEKEKNGKGEEVKGDRSGVTSLYGESEDKLKVSELSPGDVIRLLSFAKGEWKLLLLATVSLAIASGGNLVMPKFVGIFVDSVFDKTIIELSNYVAILLVVFLVVAIFSLIRASIFEIAGQRIVTNLRADVFSAIVSQEIGFFDKSRTGELLNRLSADCEVLQNAVTINVSMFLRGVVQFLGAVIMCFATSWKLTLVILSVIPVIIIFAVFYGKYIRNMSTKVQDALAISTAFAEETLSSMQTVRAFSGESYSIDYYRKSVWEVYDVQKKRALATGIWAGFAGFIASLSLAGGLWYGGSLCKSGEITPGTLTSFLFYTITVVAAVGMISSIFTDLMKAVGSSRRIFFLLDRKPLVRFIDGRTDIKITGRIRFENVSFSYPSRPEDTVLREFNLELEPGKVVALVGHSGGGKTTVAKLLAGFYYPTSGQITVDGIDIHSLEPSYWRKHIGIVSQEPTLFAISIKDNISFASDDSVYESSDSKLSRIIHVSKLANAHEFIKELKDQYDTLVGERGVRLSGGQKQRVAIARALMRDPQILVFDEATSALDSESEYKVQAALDELITHRAGKNVLVIAHRLSTVKNADEVVVIDHGRVVERGKHEDLMIKGGVYRELVSRQLESSNK